MVKQTIKFLGVLYLLGISFTWYACQKEQGDNTKGEVQFTIGNSSVSGLKSTSNTLDSAECVMLTIEDKFGNPTVYSSYKVMLNKFGDDYITKKLALPIGNYNVTGFYVLDKNDRVIYATPLESSLQAQNVERPLPLLFSVSFSESTLVEIEVISTENLNPKDFGLVSFPIKEVKTFQFLVSISESGSDRLLIADLTLTSGDYKYIQEIDSVVDNVVKIKDGFGEYILTIEKDEYQTYIDTLTNNELKQYDSIPMLIELLKSEISTVTDKDGNVYETVQIGNQVWMAENLKTTKYKDGTDIPLVTNDSEWYNNTTPGYCWYDNDEAAYKQIFGALYNWFTVETGDLCPTGWHVPADDEWKELEMALGINMSDLDNIGLRGTNEGSKLAGNAALWVDGALESDAEFGNSGFTALPGGLRINSGSYSEMWGMGFFWCATEISSDRAIHRGIDYKFSNLFRNYYGKNGGLSIRCVKD